MFGANNNKSLFGSSNTSSAFGQPNSSGFGVQSNPSAGPFGGMNASQQPQQQSIFGSTTSQPLFGSTQSSIFGSSANNPNTNTFGAQPTANAFGSTSSSIFGGTQQTSTPFGGNRFGTTSTTSPFGSTSLTQTITPTNGTTVKFVATSGTDTMMKNGLSQSINTRHQCITCMREYEMKSLEELRLEDYNANRKGPQPQSSMFGTSGVSSNNLFGTTSAPQNAFSSTSSTGLFGQNKPGFGTLAPTTTSSSGLFGTFNKPLFGTTNTFPTVQTQAPTTSIFGSVSASNPTLNQSFFSSSNANTTPAVKPLFGGQTTQPLFGQTNTQNTSLGQKSLFGNPTASVAPFGTTTNTLFNTGNTPNLFSSSQPSLFNTGATATSNTLAKPLFNFNNPTSMPINPTMGGTGTTSTPNLFGNTSNTFSNTSSMFGTGSSNFNFGSTNPSFQTNTFQPTVGLQQMATSAQPVNTEQLVTRFQTFPYGDSPQLQIDVTIPPNTKIRTKFTTDPKTLNQYKISAKTVDNRPQRIFNGSGKINTMLFDGLEEENSEENKTAKDIFVPRKNIKKLVFKPKNTSISNLNESQSPSSSFLKTQQQRESIKFNDSIASQITVNEFMPNNSDNRFSKQNQSITKERLTISPSEKGDSSPLFSRLNSTETEREQNETTLSIIIPKCGVIQTRTDYFTIPTIEELDSAYDMSSETCIVDSFTVGRHDYGSIYWDGPIDVKGINLDEIVHIRRKEVIVYPDDDVKPRIGEGLNRAAQITLHQVWPIDKTTHEIIKDNERLRSMKYAEKIETATHKLGATFKEYRPDTGSWVFTVKHFSKYGLTEEDDDEEEDELLDQSSNEAINQSIPKQIVSTKEFSANKKNLSTKESEPLALNASSDELSAKILKTKDNTMNFLLDDKDSEELDDIEADKSLDYSSQFQTEFSEYDKMRSTLFDDYEDIAVVTKKSKNYSFLVSQNEIKSKKQFQSPYFPPVISAAIKPVKLERRILTFEPDVHSAKNKIVCDISSVCVSQSPKISFFNGSRKFTFIKGGTVLICELNLINFDNSTVDRFEEQLKNNSKIIVTPSMNQIIAPFIETREFSKNSHNPLGLELLVEALYGNLSESTLYACHQERIDRILVWLFSVNKKLPLPKKTASKIIHFLSTNELEAAVDEAINTSHPRLASLLSCGNTIDKYLLIAQLDSWKCCKADLFIEKELLKIYILLSGQINWRISSGVEINILEGLNWTQQLALILLYITPSEEDNNELGVELLKTSISQLTVLPDEVEYHLLAGHTPWVAMSSSSNILESWFLHQSLKCYRVIIDENGLSASSDAVHCLLASQITDIFWSCFVASHIKHDIIRERVIKEILGRNSLKLEQNEGIEKWLLNNISLANDYMAEAKAIKSKASFNYKNLALNLIECGHWTEAHEVLVEHVFPEMIINEENDSIKELISKFKPHSHLISNWFSNGAHIYETYINCLQSSSIEDIKSFNIHQLRCNTKRQVLCQSEMARKVNILYSELSGGIHPYNTPIPDDYALLELKMNAKKLVKILC